MGVLAAEVAHEERHMFKGGGNCSDTAGLAEAQVLVQPACVGVQRGR